MGSNAGIVVRRTRVEWERLVRQWQRSGLTARAFGDAHGVRAATLAWWKWRVGTAPRRREAEPPPRLVAVDVIEPGADRDEDAALAWELISATGARLRVRGPLSGADLRVVVEAFTSTTGRARRR